MLSKINFSVYVKDSSMLCILHYQAADAMLPAKQGLSLRGADEITGPLQM